MQFLEHSWRRQETRRGPHNIYHWPHSWEGPLVSPVSYVQLVTHIRMCTEGHTHVCTHNTDTDVLTPSHARADTQADAHRCLVHTQLWRLHTAALPAAGAGHQRTQGKWFSDTTCVPSTSAQGPSTLPLGAMWLRH